MIYILISIIAILAVLMVLVVLAQDSKSGALSSSFGASQVMGVKRTTDLLEKLTWGFMIGIMVLVMSSKFVQDASVETEEPTSVVSEKLKSKPAPQQTPSLNPTTAPGPDSGKTGDSAK
jgi:preprotein translocase subunit SecG